MSLECNRPNMMAPDAQLKFRKLRWKKLTMELTSASDRIIMLLNGLDNCERHGAHQQTTSSRRKSS